MSPDLPPAQQLTRRLIDYGQTLEAPGPYSEYPAAAALERLYLDLARWVGFDGCHALFTRAFSEARVEHPLLETIELQPRSTPYIEGVAETAQKSGASETDQALAATLVIVIEVLGRLIGDEMATILIERGLPESADDVASQESGRAKA